MEPQGGALAAADIQWRTRPGDGRRQVHSLQMSTGTYTDSSVRDSGPPCGDETMRTIQ